jgi:citronellol/citronellal dehydrogenase
MQNLKNKVAIISGSSRGIGEAIAIKLAACGAKVVITGKSTEPDPRLGGTIYTVRDKIIEAGGEAIAIPCDVRIEEQIIAVVNATVAAFYGIDIVVNNASAIRLTGTADTSAKAYDLMQQINVRGTYLLTHHSLPHLKKSSHAHILNLSPPISIKDKWLAPHLAYTISKYNMSLLAIGWAAEFKAEGIAANALWPRTTIATAAVRNLLGGEQLVQMSRTPAIMADAAALLLNEPTSKCTGHCLLDEEVLARHGITDLSHYAVNPGGPLFTDLFLDG